MSEPLSRIDCIVLTGPVAWAEPVLRGDGGSHSPARHTFRFASTGERHLIPEDEAERLIASGQVARVVPDASVAVEQADPEFTEDTVVTTVPAPRKGRRTSRTR